MTRNGVDYSYDRPPISALLAAGATFCCRYLSFNPVKNLIAAEAQALTTAGIDIVSNWQNKGSWVEISGGYSIGRAHAIEAERQHQLCGAPPARPVFFSVDFNPTTAQLATIGEYFRGVTSYLGVERTGAYGGYRTIRHLFDQGLITWGWQTYAWSDGRWDSRAQLRQTLNNQTIGGADVDLDVAIADDFGQWRGDVAVTNAPPDLLDIQRYVAQQTGLPVVELGIVGDAAHSGGYHCGYDRTVAGDYSVVDSPRDKAGLTLAASAFDLGGNFPRFREITLAIVAACKRGDPRARDIRSVIYTPDGVNVDRWDRLGIRTGGSSSHLFHTHLSFFRDSEGRRNRDDNVLGLLKTIFTGATGADMTPEEHATLMWAAGRLYGLTSGAEKVDWTPPDAAGLKGEDIVPNQKLRQLIEKPAAAVTIDAATLAVALQDPAVVKALAGAVRAELDRTRFTT